MADLLVDRGELVKVHYFDGFPYTGYALAGVAELGDVVLANDNGNPNDEIAAKTKEVVQRNLAASEQA